MFRSGRENRHGSRLGLSGGEIRIELDVPEERCAIVEAKVWNKGAAHDGKHATHMPRTKRARAETENSLAVWNPKKASGQVPTILMPHSRTRQGLSMVPVRHAALDPVAFQPVLETPERHGRCVWRSKGTERSGTARHRS